MSKITFIQTNGEAVVIEHPLGTLMEIATENGVEGITGDCGGVCSCSTCHVYVDREWQDRLPPAGQAEKDTLDWNDHQKPNSRLGCQIEMSDALDGLVVEVAPAE